MSKDFITITMIIEAVPLQSLKLKMLRVSHLWPIRKEISLSVIPLLKPLKISSTISLQRAHFKVLLSSVTDCIDPSTDANRQITYV
jgi:hypothetical protein